jgi:hypothetical protein
LKTKGSTLARNLVYVPLSKDLSHPADRRRIKIWSDYYKIPLIQKDLKMLDSKDILVLSSAGKLSEFSIKHKGPVIIDLVDGYLSYKTPFIEDFSRNTLRAFLNRSSFSSITFSNELKRAISRANAVVVSCPEQKQSIMHLNADIHCILGDHSELKFVSDETTKKSSKEFTILWEGLGYTLKHLFSIADELEKFILDSQGRLIIVTNSFYSRWANSFGQIDVKKLISTKLSKVIDRVEFIEWSIENLQMASSRSDVAIIPIDLSDKFAAAKPENKLLSFWTMGVPTLCSPTDAYTRVLTEAKCEEFLVLNRRWFEVLGRISNLIRNDKCVLVNKQLEFRDYLDKFHSRENLVKKWNSLLQDYLA